MAFLIITVIIEIIAIAIIFVLLQELNNQNIKLIKQIKLNSLEIEELQFKEETTSSVVGILISLMKSETKTKKNKDLIDKALGDENNT